MNKKRRVLIIVAICWTTHLHDGGASVVVGILNEDRAVEGR